MADHLLGRVNDALQFADHQTVMEVRVDSVMESLPPAGTLMPTRAEFNEGFCDSFICCFLPDRKLVILLQVELCSAENVVTF